MKELFVPYGLSVKLKEKGFNEDCLGCYASFYETTTPDFHTSYLEEFQDYDVVVAAPLYQQVVAWFEKFDIFIHAKTEILGSDEWDFGYVIDYIPQEFREAKRRTPYFQTITSYKEGIGSYTGAWHTSTEAIHAAIEKALTLI